MEWPALNRLMEAAQRRSQAEARRLARAILANSTNEAERAVARAFLEGARSSFQAHAAALALPASIVNDLPRPVAKRMRSAAAQQANVTVNGIRALGDTTREVVERYADTATREAVWQGQDKAGREAANLAEAEFKTWVRSWPRKRERDHHDMLEGVTIPASDRFVLPGGYNAGFQVTGPRDWDSIPSQAEWVNCGHALRYSREATREDTEKTRRLGSTVYEPPDPSRPSPRSVDRPRLTRRLRPQRGPASVAPTDDARELRRQYLDQWVHGSRRKASITLKRAVNEEFGVRGVVYTRRTYNISQGQVRQARRAARVTYEDTQKALKNAGVKEVTLYRGVKARYDDRQSGSLESWTSDLGTASKFAGANGDIMEKRIPANRIFAYHEAPGWKNGKFGQQYEYVVMPEAPQ